MGQGAVSDPNRDGYAHYPLAQWRNGQWADPMLAHAGAEAVRLVPGERSANCEQTIGATWWLLFRSPVEAQNL